VAVHEIGHALGLQHTWTASAMSQGVIRNTDRSRPIDADDIASLLVLYGNAATATTTDWHLSYASITGKVLLANGTGVSMASVVAIPAEGPAVSTLTNPDGTFTIQGLPPNNTYQVYVHPLPPDALASTEGLLLPTDLNGVPFSASAPFAASFYGGFPSPVGSAPWALSAGQSVPYYLSFVVQPLMAVTAYDLITLSYLDPIGHTYSSSPPANYVSVTPAYETVSQAEMLVYSEGAPSGGGSTAVPQSVTLLGGFSPAGPCAADNSVAPCFIPYQNTAGLFSYFIPPPSAGTGPRHLVYTFANDMFVLPDAVVLVNNGPPYVNAVTGNGDGSVTVTGGNFGPDSRVFFDGLPAVSEVNNYESGSITATPPASSGGQVATVTVFDSDGQNSSFYSESGGNPPAYSLPASGTPAMFVSPSAALAAGSSGMLTINGTFTHFVSGQVTVGFGSSDITVSNMLVVSPTQLWVNVSVAAGAAIGTTEISVISGYQVITQPGGFQVLPANGTSNGSAAGSNTGSPSIAAVVSTATTTALAPGSVGTIYGTNLLPASGSPAVTVGGTTAPLYYSGSGQINFQVPANLPTGPAILTLTIGSTSVNYGVTVANPPPTIVSIVDTTQTLSAPGPGDILAVQVNGLLDSTAQVTVSGIGMPLVSVAGGQILFVLDQSFAGSPVPIAVVVDGAASLPYTLTVR
jgi:hypothetical protein